MHRLSSARIRIISLRVQAPDSAKWCRRCARLPERGLRGEKMKPAWSAWAHRFVDGVISLGQGTSTFGIYGSTQSGQHLPLTDIHQKEWFGDRDPPEGVFEALAHGPEGP